jgi:predicted metal-dependent hydrolase
MERAYPEEYVKFLAHFHGDRDYFECHELLEEYWKEHPQSPYRVTWVCLIQSAVGMYHYRRGNIAGAAKSLEGSLRRFRPEELSELGVDAEVWRERLEATVTALRNGDKDYRDIDVPITDERLLARGRYACESMGVPWGAPSRMEEPELIHRHTLRDRSDVIEARRNALASRRDGR